MTSRGKKIVATSWAQDPDATENVDTKPLRKVFVRLNSYYRQNDNTNSADCRFSLNNQLLTGARHISIESISMPNMFYNVTHNDDSFRIRHGVGFATTTTVIVPVGYYTITQLVDYINAQIVASNIALTVNEVTKRVKIDGGELNPFYIANVANSIYYTLGWSNSNVIEEDPAGYESFTGPFAYDMSGVTSVYIHSNMLPLKSVDTFGETNDCIFTLSMDQPFGKRTFWKASSEELASTNTTTGSANLTNFYIQLRDKWGYQLDLNGTEWDMVIVAYCE